MTHSDLDILTALFPKRELDEYDAQREAEAAERAERDAMRHEMMMDESSVWYDETYARRFNRHTSYKVDIRSCEIVNPR